MSGTLVDDAVRVLRELPEEMQAAVARPIIDCAAGEDIAAAG